MKHLETVEISLEDIIGLVASKHPSIHDSGKVVVKHNNPNGGHYTENLGDLFYRQGEKIVVTWDQDDGHIDAQSTLFDPMWLSAANPQKIKAIKCVKEITGLGLRESKDIVEMVFASPSLQTNFAHHCITRNKHELKRYLNLL